jgi:predicted nucleic acid-binding protein
LKNLEIVVVADANVLLSAAVGKAVQKAFYKPIEVYTTQHTYKELLKYLPAFCEMYHVTEGDALDQIKKLQLVVKSKSFYKSKLVEAWELIGKRDPKDVDILALTLKLNVPIWSNDNDFKDLPVKRFTTAQILKKLGI